MLRKIDFDRSRTLPRASYDRSKRPQDRSRKLQDGPKILPRGFLSASAALHGRLRPSKTASKNFNEVFQQGFSRRFFDKVSFPLSEPSCGPKRSPAALEREGRGLGHRAAQDAQDGQNPSEKCVSCVLALLEFVLKIFCFARSLLIAAGLFQERPMTLPRGLKGAPGSSKIQTQ